MMGLPFDTSFGTTALVIGVAAACVAALLYWSYQRVLLSRAKHPSLEGHARIARLLSSFLHGYDYSEVEVFASDGAPQGIARQRHQAFDRLCEGLQRSSPVTTAATLQLQETLSDLQFTAAYAIPFQYRRYINSRITVGALLTASDGVRVTDMDGHSAYDLSGSYGVNVLGYEFYKRCIDEGIARARSLGPVLGAYLPIIQDNVDRLRRISELDEVSFHMSGTEAIMQAVRLARFHTGRSHLVRFAGAYHGWWDDVQPGIGNPRAPGATYTLKDMAAETLRVLSTRRDIACVLVNPLQALHPNTAASGDGTLIASNRRAGADREAYAAWLQELRSVCGKRGIVFILDEVFTGFRLARRGAQEYFQVSADLVAYGKTVAGGLPIGVLCGSRGVMRRFRDDRPSQAVLRSRHVQFPSLRHGDDEPVPVGTGRCTDPCALRSRRCDLG